MKLYMLLALVGYAAAECATGYWAAEANGACTNACSDGCVDSACNPVGGACTTVKECTKGWKSDEAGRCDQPICSFVAEGQGCSEGGKCVAPETCICGESGAQVVAKSQADEAGKHIGFDCVSLRKDGLMGAGVALIVMSISISICGGIAEKNGKAK